MSEHKKLARLVARAFYRHSSTRDRLARVGNAKYDNSRTAEVLIDALTRRAWVKEDDLARAVLLSSKQVRKALHYLEEQRIVRRAHVREKDKEREEKGEPNADELKLPDRDPQRREHHKDHKHGRGAGDRDESVACDASDDHRHHHLLFHYFLHHTLISI